MKRVTGIGGVFFKSTDPKKTNDWYAKHLGVDVSEWGANFEWREKESPDQIGSTAWTAFKQETKYFEPSKKEFMINYRVENLEWLVEELKKEGVTICDSIESHDYGKFVHIMDNDGNKIQLWEPK
jgi:predicted enzyme related to lactoylglutathione lyase